MLSIKKNISKKPLPPEIYLNIYLFHILLPYPIHLNLLQETILLQRKFQQTVSSIQDISRCQDLQTLNGWFFVSKSQCLLAKSIR